jgi:assimilatory nitrate reductase electron transfer subunit
MSLMGSPGDCDMLICFCHGVPEAEIRKAIEEGARTVAEIQARTRASTGCGGCRPEVERLLAELLERKTGS